MTKKKIILEYLKEGDMNIAYVYFKETLKNLKLNESKKQVIFDGYGSEDAKKEGLELIVDFDENDKIIGIEILNSKDFIPENLQ